MDDLLEIIRREISAVLGNRQFKNTLIATSYDKERHAVKGILVPSGVETGWVPIGTIGVGNGFGVVVGPKVGSAEKLDGDQFDIEFENGDPNTPIARHRFFSDKDKPPQVESGEILVQHEKGHKLFFAKDGSVSLYHKEKGGEIKFDKDGNISIDAKDQNINVNAGNGTVKIKGTIDINGD